MIRESHGSRRPHRGVRMVSAGVPRLGRLQALKFKGRT